MFDRSKRDFADVQVGDEVIVTGTHVYRSEKVDTVTKVLKRYFEVRSGLKFRKDGGYEWGARSRGSYTYYGARKGTPEELDAVRRECRRKRMAEALGRVRWADYSYENLDEVFQVMVKHNKAMAGQGDA